MWSCWFVQVWVFFQLRFIFDHHVVHDVDEAWGCFIHALVRGGLNFNGSQLPPTFPPLLSSTPLLLLRSSFVSSTTTPQDDYAPRWAPSLRRRLLLTAAHSIICASPLSSLNSRLPAIWVPRQCDDVDALVSLRIPSVRARFLTRRRQGGHLQGCANGEGDRAMIVSQHAAHHTRGGTYRYESAGPVHAYWLEPRRRAQSHSPCVHDRSQGHCSYWRFYTSNTEVVDMRGAAPALQWHSYEDEDLERVKVKTSVSHQFQLFEHSASNMIP